MPATSRWDLIQGLRG